jgi:glycosyltransferase involved in cell wall biosynthesis
VGGAPDVVRDGVTGLLVAPHALDGFAAAVLRAIDMPAAERARMGTAARARARADFSIEAERDATLRVYRGLVGDRGSGAADALAPGGRRPGNHETITTGGA